MLHTFRLRGGIVFIKSALQELKARRRGIMTLISLAMVTSLRAGILIPMGFVMLMSVGTED